MPFSFTVPISIPGLGDNVDPRVLAQREADAAAAAAAKKAAADQVIAQQTAMRVMVIVGGFGLLGLVAWSVFTRRG